MLEGRCNYQDLLPFPPKKQKEILSLTIAVWKGGCFQENERPPTYMTALPIRASSIRPSDDDSRSALFPYQCVFDYSARG